MKRARTFNPQIKTKGFIGTHDYSGTVAYIKLGTYTNQGAHSLTPFNWVDAYFDGGSYTYQDWGWTYHYKSQTWNNYDLGNGGNSGDIII